METGKRLRIKTMNILLYGSGGDDDDDDVCSR